MTLKTDGSLCSPEKSVLASYASAPRLRSAVLWDVALSLRSPRITATATLNKIFLLPSRFTSFPKILKVSAFVKSGKTETQTITS